MISFLSSIIIKCWGKLELVDPLEKLWKTENNGAYQGSENMLVDGRGKSVWWSYGQVFFLISQSQHGGKNWLNNSADKLIIFKPAPKVQVLYFTPTT